MTVFVTGAAGHLGANVVRALLANGEQVRALVRPRSNNAALEGLPIERAEGDLASSQLEELLAGCDRLVHLAAMISLRESDRAKMMEANVVATRRLLQAALRVGIARTVHCSSIGAIGVGPDGTADETHDPDLFGDLGFYERTKVLAEVEVLRAVSDGLAATIVNPSGLIGPHDHKPSLLGRTILDFVWGRLPLYVQGGHDFVSVVDVAHGTLLALERGRPGRRYLLAGEYATIGQILTWVSEQTGRAVPRVALPASVLMPWVGAKDWIERIVLPTRHPRFNRHSIAMLQTAGRTSTRRAREELGWTPGPLRDAVVAQLDWFRETGRLPQEPATSTTQARGPGW